MSGRAESPQTVTLSSLLVHEENRNGGEAPERKIAMSSFGDDVRGFWCGQ